MRGGEQGRERGVSRHHHRRHYHSHNMSREHSQQLDNAGPAAAGQEDVAAPEPEPTEHFREQGRQHKVSSEGMHSLCGCGNGYVLSGVSP